MLNSTEGVLKKVDILIQLKEALGGGSQNFILQMNIVTYTKGENYGQLAIFYFAK